MSNKTRKKKKKGLLSTAGKSIKILIGFTVVLFFVIIYFRYGRDVITMYQEAALMVKLSNSDTFCSVQTSVVYDTDGNEIKTLSGEKDIYYVDYADIPQYFIDAMVAVEDRKFYEHSGIDAKGIARAFAALIQHDGKITQGGSTITQQLAKNIFLSNEVTWKRKVMEAFVAIDLEKKYSKAQIMEFYLNNIYFANGYYGIDAAARGYFGQELTKLSLSQIAFLCAIPNNPSYYNPVDNMEHTLERRDKILEDMLDEGYINELDYTIAVSETITLNMKSEEYNNYAETYIYYQATEALMQAGGFTLQYDFSTQTERNAYEEEYNTMYSECQQSLFTAGYRIYTSMDLDVQQMLQEELDDALSDYQEVSDEGVYTLQGSAVCIDNQTGYVCAVVGGRSQEDIQGYTLNRAYQSPRQPGSAIKPLNVYLPAFEDGLHLETMITAYDDDGNEIRSMKIYDAVIKSNNDIARQVYKEITPARGMAYLAKMKFKSIMPEDKEVMSGALGGFTYGATTEEMAAAYACIANGGNYIAPSCIIQITDADGEVLYENTQESVEVYDSNSTAMMTSALQGVLGEGGTAEGYAIQNMHSAGKTGTTNKNYDGWFCGFTPYYTTAVWVGYDMPKQLKQLQGNTYPVKIWNRFMTRLHDGLVDVEFSKFYYTKPKEETTEASTEDESKQKTKKETNDEVQTTSAETATEAVTEDVKTTQEDTEKQTTEEYFEDEKELEETTGELSE